MGQSQLLLIVLAVIIVAIAVIVGIQIFSLFSATSNLEAVTNDLLVLASKGQEYYVKPKMMGGGGHSFEGLTIDKLTVLTDNENGEYSVISAGSRKLVLEGVGNLDGDDDGDNCTVRANVYQDSIAVEFISR